MTKFLWLLLIAEVALTNFYTVMMLTGDKTAYGHAEATTLNACILICTLAIIAAIRERK